MSNNKAVRADNISIKVCKIPGDRGIDWFTKFFNEIMRSKQMPDVWRKITLVPIYRNKGDL